MKTIDTDNFQAVFVNTDKQPLKTEHICWYTGENLDGDLTLVEVVRETYRHPDAPEVATVSVINEHTRQTTNKYHGRAFIRQLEMTQQLVSDSIN